MIVKLNNRQIAKVNNRQVDARNIVIGVQSDNNVEVLDFIIARYTGTGIDLSLGIGYAVFQLPDGTNGFVTLTPEVLEDDENRIKLTLPVGAQLTAQKGTVKMCLKISGLEFSLWNSALFTLFVAGTLPMAEPLPLSLFTEASTRMDDAESEPPITITERNMNIPAELKTIAVQNDENSESVKIVVPRYFDGNDLSAHEFLLHTEMGTNGTDDIVFNGTQGQTKEVKGTTVELTWVLRPPQTSFAGKLSAQVYVYGEGFKWHSYVGEFTVARHISGDPVVPDTPTLFEQFLEQVKQYRDEAASSASSATASKTAAAQSAASALSSKNAAAISASQAADSAQGIQEAKDDAAQSAASAEESAIRAENAARESLGFRTFNGSVRPDENGDLDPSRPMFAGTGESVTVKATGDRINNVIIHGFTTQAGSGDPSPDNVRPIIVAGLDKNLVNLSWREFTRVGVSVKCENNKLIWSGVASDNFSGYTVWSFEGVSLQKSLAPGKYTIALVGDIDVTLEFFFKRSNATETQDAITSVSCRTGEKTVVELTESCVNIFNRAWRSHVKGVDYTGKCVYFSIMGGEVEKPTVNAYIESDYAATIYTQGKTLEQFTVGLNEPLCEDAAIDTVGTENHSWGFLKLTENDNWGVRTGPTADGEKPYFTLYLNDVPYGAQTVCDTYTNFGYQVPLKNNAISTSIYLNNGFTVRDDRFSDVESWKQHLKSNPITVLYKRRTIKSYTNEPVEITAVPSGDGTFKVSSESEVSVYLKPFSDASTVNGKELASVAASGSYNDLTNKPTALKNPNALTLQMGESNEQVYDGSEAKTFNVTPANIGALGTTEKAASAKVADAASGYAFYMGYTNKNAGIEAQTKGVRLSWGKENSYKLFFGQDPTYGNALCLHASSNGTYALGNSTARWASIYSTNGTIQTSDATRKEQVTALGEKQLAFFEKLRPVSYKLKSGFDDAENHDRLHYGFIAQEVEQAMGECGITAMEFGGLCKDKEIVLAKTLNEDGTESLASKETGADIYSLRYQEFIALNTAAIQALKAEIAELKNQLNKLTEQLK